jgi:tetratricopeptide (TPR) repeat protein
LVEKKLSLRALVALFGILIALPFWALGDDTSGIKFLPTTAARSNSQLWRADSLFALGQYAAAAPLYRQQVWRQRQASPQLLLRMAFAQQQLGHYPAALLYLNLAQARQPHVRTWRQIAALATQYRLVGYPATWQQELRVQVQRYYYVGLEGLLAGAIVGAVWLLLRLRRARRNGWLAYLGYLLLTGGYLYWLRPTPAGLVARPGAALMAGPGAGATWLSTAAVGDRLTVLGTHDIWYRVQWRQQDAFIRQADLLVIE